jgi:hypothetical protein
MMRTRGGIWTEWGVGMTLNKRLVNLRMRTIMFDVIHIRARLVCATHVLLKYRPLYYTHSAYYFQLVHGSILNLLLLLLHLPTLSIYNTSNFNKLSAMIMYVIHVLVSINLSIAAVTVGQQQNKFSERVLHYLLASSPYPLILLAHPLP